MNIEELVRHVQKEHIDRNISVGYKCCYTVICSPFDLIEMTEAFEQNVIYECGKSGKPPIRVSVVSDYEYKEGEVSIVTKYMMIAAKKGLNGYFIEKSSWLRLLNENTER